MIYAPMPEKCCSKCRETKSLLDFRRWKNNQDGHQDNCKTCGHVKYNPQKAHEYYSVHKESAARARKRWAMAHPDKIRQANARYKEKARAAYGIYKRKEGTGTSQTGEASRNWKRAHPKERKIERLRRRTITSALPCDFRIEDWQRALDYWHGCCAICGRQQGIWHKIAADHWIPISDPRPSNPGAVPWNILPLCHGIDGCNNSKGNKDPIKWLNARLGPRKAKAKLREIEAFFEWAKANHR